MEEKKKNTTVLGIRERWTKPMVKCTAAWKTKENKSRFETNMQQKWYHSTAWINNLLSLYFQKNTKKIKIKKMCKIDVELWINVSKIKKGREINQRGKPQGAFLA